MEPGVPPDGGGAAPFGCRSAAKLSIVSLVWGDPARGSRQPSHRLSLGSRVTPWAHPLPGAGGVARAAGGAPSPHPRDCSSSGGFEKALGELGHRLGPQPHVVVGSPPQTRPGAAVARSEVPSRFDGGSSAGTASSAVGGARLTLPGNQLPWARIEPLADLLIRRESFEIVSQNSQNGLLSYEKPFPNGYISLQA
jgi:hypothetical protein